MTMLASVIEQFAARTGMVIVRPVSSTPWFPNVSCLLANPVFLLYLREDKGKPVTMLAPTFGPIHWFSLTDVVRDQQNEWSPDWSPRFDRRSVENQLEEVERRLEFIREAFMPEHFLEFSTRVRTGYLSMGPSRSDPPEWGEFDWDELE